MFRENGCLIACDGDGDGIMIRWHVGRGDVVREGVQRPMLCVGCLIPRSQDLGRQLNGD